MKRPSATDGAGAAATASLGGGFAALSRHRLVPSSMPAARRPASSPSRRGHAIERRLRAMLLCLASAVAPVAQAVAPSTGVDRVVGHADEALRVGTRPGATITDKGTLR
jgi:hypothetical protein